MELVRYSPGNLKTNSPAKTYRRLTIIFIALFICAATAILVFAVLSQRDKMARSEAERGELAAQLSSTSSRLHALSLEVDSLAARTNPAPILVTTPAIRKGTLPRGNDSVAKLPSQPHTGPAATSPATAAKPSAVTPQQAPSVTSPDYSAEINQLNGSIATTHEQVMELERRGARHYVEFTMARSPNFKEVGPLWLQIRKINSKHASYDISIIVNGYRLEKSHVNLFEPIWINTTDKPMQFQLVANSLAKNQVAGYLSEPKAN